MICPVCDERMIQDDTYDAIMGNIWKCPNGCIKCLTEGCTRQAEPDSDACAICDLEEAIRQAMRGNEAA